MADLRVHTTPELRSKSFDATSPSKILTLHPVHQCHTRNNNLFDILEDDEEPDIPLHPPDNDETMADNITVPTSNYTGGTNLDPFLHHRVEYPRNIDMQPRMLHSPQNQPATQVAPQLRSPPRLPTPKPIPVHVLHPLPTPAPTTPRRMLHTSYQPILPITIPTKLTTRPHARPPIMPPITNLPYKPNPALGQPMCPAYI